MKRKYAAMMLGLVLTISSMNVYAVGAATETASETDAADTTSDIADAADNNTEEATENEVVGQVKSVSDTDITIAIGTLKENIDGADGQTVPEKPEDADSMTSDNGEAADETESAETDTTEANTTETDAVETDSIETDSTAEGTESGPSDAAPTGDAAPSMIDLNGEEQTVTVAEDATIQKQLMQMGKPADQNGTMPAGDAAGADSTESDVTEETAESEAVTTDAAKETADVTEDTTEETTETADAKEPTDGEEPADMGEVQQPEDIKLSDIKEGDIVKITLDEEGNASAITVVFQAADETAKPDDAKDAVAEADGTTAVDDTTENSDTTDEAAES